MPRPGLTGLDDSTASQTLALPPSLPPPPTQLPFLGSHRHLHLSLRPLLFAARYALVRHTKAQSLGGEGVLQLPHKTEAEVPGACDGARV